MAAANDACTDSQSPDADDDLENGRIDKSCLVCGISKSKPPSKEKDTKEQLQPSSNSSPREGSTHDESLDYSSFNPAEDIKEQLPSSNSSPREESTHDKSFDYSPFNLVEDTKVQVKVLNQLVLPEQLQSPSEESGEKDQPVAQISNQKGSLNAIRFWIHETTFTAFFTFNCMYFSF